MGAKKLLEEMYMEPLGTCDSIDCDEIAYFKHTGDIKLCRACSEIINFQLKK